MDNIEEILRALSEDSPEDESGNSGNETQKTDENGGGLFDGLDMEMLIKLMTMFSSMNQQDDNERFLLALKPLLREENRGKIDSAMKLMKLFALIPILKESGMLGKLF